VLEDVQLMLQNYAKWRVDFKTDDIERTLDFPELPLVKQAFTFFYHGVCKEGTPIHIECQGRINGTNLWKCTNVERLFRFMVMHNEELLNFKLPVCS